MKTPQQWQKELLNGRYYFREEIVAIQADAREDLEKENAELRAKGFPIECAWRESQEENSKLRQTISLMLDDQTAPWKELVQLRERLAKLEDILNSASHDRA